MTHETTGSTTLPTTGATQIPSVGPSDPRGVEMPSETNLLPIVGVAAAGLAVFLMVR